MNDIDKRLEEIEKKVKTNDPSWSSLTTKDELWLISTIKAEREEKENQKEITKRQFSSMCNLQQQIKQYEKALSFYADTKNYENTEYKTSDWLPTLPIDRDHGEKARQALGGDRYEDWKEHVLVVGGTLYKGEDGKLHGVLIVD